MYVNAAKAIPAKPSQVMPVATVRGIFANWELKTATRPPRASSHARVKGEKNAATLLTDVWWIDQAIDAMTTPTSKAVSFGRIEIRFQHRAVTRKRVGYTR